MAWQLAAIWAITAITVFAFARDEVLGRRQARVSPRPGVAIKPREIHQRQPVPVRTPAALDQADMVFIDRLRKVQLKSIGF